MRWNRQTKLNIYVVYKFSCILKLTTCIINMPACSMQRLWGRSFQFLAVIRALMSSGKCTCSLQLVACSWQSLEPTSHLTPISNLQQCGLQDVPQCGQNAWCLMHGVISFIKNMPCSMQHYSTMHVSCSLCQLHIAPLAPCKFGHWHYYRLPCKII